MTTAPATTAGSLYDHLNPDERSAAGFHFHNAASSVGPDATPDDVLVAVRRSIGERIQVLRKKPGGEHEANVLSDLWVNIHRLPEEAKAFAALRMGRIHETPAERDERRRRNGVFRILQQWAAEPASPMQVEFLAQHRKVVPIGPLSRAVAAALIAEVKASEPVL